MNAVASVQTRTTPILYPESDDKPMADNTKQFNYIALIVLCLKVLFKYRSDVFVAATSSGIP